ncbi:LysR family transcriptional regulator [Pseudonocardia xishanensis]|uniref:LysR family transcriptional regulator n=1 Tax=Pseudonocardia xishanensis TaxID=630995 RepID=A0ABP8RVR2_9PSEU
MPDPINLRQLAYFLAAADARSMTGAAKALRVSQSAVSQAVAALERRLAVQLLLRHRSKGLTLTAAGAEVVADARALLAHSDELFATARSLGTELAGRLVIGCFLTLAPFLLPQLLEGFHRRHPGVHVEFIEGSMNELRRLLQNGECELALLYDLEVMPKIQRELLYTTTPSVLLHPDHPLAAEAEIPLSALSGEPLVLLDVEPSYEFYHTLLTNAGIDINIRYRAGSFEMARALVGRGFGISMLIQRPAIDFTYEGSRIVTRPVADDVNGPSIVLAHAADATLTRRARAFASFCRASLPPSGGV